MKKNALSLLLLSLFVFSLTHAVGFQGISGYPAHPDPNDIRTKSWFLYTIDPGTTKEDAVVITNGTDTDQEISLTVVDSTVDNLGGFALKNENDTQEGIGVWLRLSKPSILLKAGEQVEIPFALTIPAGVAPGEYSGGVIIQKIQKISEDTKDPGFSINTRMGVRVYATVSGKIERNLKLSPLKVEEIGQDNLYRVGVTLQNTGNVSVDSTMTLTTSQDFLFIHENFDQEKIAQIQRGNSTTTYFTVPKHRIGNLSFSVKATYNDGEVEKTLQTETVTLSNIPWVLFAGIALGVVLIVLVWSKFSKKRKSSGTREKSEVQEDTKRKKPILLYILLLFTLLAFATVLNLYLQEKQGKGQQQEEQKTQTTQTTVTKENILDTDDIKLLLTVLPDAGKEDLLTAVPASMQTAITTAVPSEIIPIIQTQIPKATLTAYATYLPSSTGVPVDPNSSVTPVFPVATTTTVAMPSATSNIPPSAILLTVLNGTSKSGAAKMLSDKLVALGYQVARIGNADKQNYTVTEISYPPALVSSVQRLTGDLATLGYLYVLKEDSSLGMITIIYGEKSSGGGGGGGGRPSIGSPTLTPVARGETRALLEITPH